MPKMNNGFIAEGGRMEEASGQNDWQVDRTVLQCNKYMLDNQINCDVTFSFSTGMAFEYLFLNSTQRGGVGRKGTLTPEYMKL